MRKLPASTTDFNLLNNLIVVHENTSSALDRSVYNWWKKWNNIYFEDTLKPLFIYYGNTNYGKYIGQYSPEPREILLQKSSINSFTKTSHHTKSVIRHKEFQNISEQEYGTALVLLHEMMHQAVDELQEPQHLNCHLDPNWLDHCNFIGNDLGLKLTFATLTRTKESKKEKQQLASLRKNIWRAKKNSILTPGTERFATYSECRMFPFNSDEKTSALISF